MKNFRPSDRLYAKLTPAEKLNVERFIAHVHNVLATVINPPCNIIFTGRDNAKFLGEIDISSWHQMDFVVQFLKEEHWKAERNQANCPALTILVE
jgi:hypothetical protein